MVGVCLPATTNIENRVWESVKTFAALAANMIQAQLRITHDLCGHKEA
jgi:hypothetical protein